MAYSDYGGYGYRNGRRVDERSDAVLSPEGLKSTPGAWPGWTLSEGRTGGSYHVILGDGPIFVSLYKQSSLGIHRLSDRLEEADYLVDPQPGDVTDTEWNGKRSKYINDDNFDENRPAIFLVDGIKITVYWIWEDNHYQYVKMEQPDGTVWTGFSGYGVGAGLEDCGYGYDTDEREERLFHLFPDAKS